MSALLYRDAQECPICFNYFPRLNLTRCCHQEICSECFLQIKRPEPHGPYSSLPSSPTEHAETSSETLISEPASCPYCMMPQFGVQYHSGPVIYTDDIRPDWASKLAHAKHVIARRAAAATALHTAAFSTATTDRRCSVRRESASYRPSRRMAELEEMMIMEAIRLSLQDEAPTPQRATSPPSLTLSSRAETSSQNNSADHSPMEMPSANSSSSDFAESAVRSLDEQLLEGSSPATEQDLPRAPSPLKQATVHPEMHRHVQSPSD